MSREDQHKVLPFGRPGKELTPRLVRERPKEAEKIFDGLPFAQQLQLASERRGTERVQLILLSKKAKPLVQSLPEPEFYFTLKEAGEEEAAALLALAAPAQLTYVFDLEFWAGDELGLEKFGRWLELLRQADPAQFQAWLERADPELLIALLSKLVSVWVVDPDNLGAEPWREQENLFTLDEQYYFQALEEDLRPVTERVLIGLRELEAEKFYRIMDEVRLTPAAENEATAYRVRQGRLSDHGFYEFDEAFSIYQFLPESRWRELEQNPERPESKPAAPSRYPVLLSKEIPSLLGRTLKELGPAQLEDFYLQLARLCNKLMVADTMDLTELDNLKLAVEKAFGYLELGLEAWSEGDLAQAAQILTRQWLDHVFQAGFSEVLKLRFRASALAEASWFKALDRPFFLFGETEAGRLQALLEKRPKFYSGDKTLQVREFRSNADLAALEQTLEQAEFRMKLFFEALGLEPQRLKELMAAYPVALTFEVLLATWLINAQPGFEPIALKDLIAFARKAAPKAVMLQKLEAATEGKNLDPGRLVRFFETSFAALESELAGIKDPEQLDPRFLNSLVLKKASEPKPE